MKLIKHIKFALASVAAVAMAVTGLSATPAYAESNYSKNVTFQNVAEGDTVVAYQLVGYSSDYHSMELKGSFKNFVAGRSQKTTEQEQIDWFANLDPKDVDAQLKYYVNKWGSSYTAPGVYKSVTKTGNTDPTMSFDPGYYLILPITAGNNSALYASLSVFVRVDGSTSTVTAAGGAESQSDITVAMKREDAPSIKKYVVRKDGTLHEAQTVAVGEQVSYAVKITLPGYGTTGGDPEFVLHDTPVNVTYNANSAKVYEVADNGGISQTEIAGAILDESVDTNGVNLGIDYSKVATAQGVQRTFYVVYTATVTDGIVANADANGLFSATNSAYLSYRTTPQAGSVSKTDASSTVVYTYAFNLAKLNDNNAALTGASFKIYEGTDTTGAALKFTKTQAGYYEIDANGTERIDANAGASANELTVRGLDASKTYTVVESVTPNGYFEPAGTFTLALASQKKSGSSDEHTGALANSSTLTCSDQADNALIHSAAPEGAVFKVQLKNSATPSLPTTGGMGTVLFTVVGAAVMVAAAAFFIVSRKKNN